MENFPFAYLHYFGFTGFLCTLLQRRDVIEEQWFLGVFSIVHSIHSVRPQCPNKHIETTLSFRILFRIHRNIQTCLFLLLTDRSRYSHWKQWRHSHYARSCACRRRAAPLRTRCKRPLIRTLQRRLWRRAATTRRNVNGNSCVEHQRFQPAPSATSDFNLSYSEDYFYRSVLHSC